MTMVLPHSADARYKINSKMKSGVYTIGLDEDVHDRKKAMKGTVKFEVYCDVEYDKAGNFVGAATLVETMASNQYWTNYYNRYTFTGDYNSPNKANTARVWAAGTRNYASIVAVKKFNSIFKHSVGVIQTRWNSNTPG